ncbi:hypothetical protein [Leeuwenhoekiella sp. ZYFB001]|uniref:hypothetical protein n=1 Tax=Leeuwenhoekiella sp. ZYFB001 TaxID=2719912 RepID=UPI0014312C70|nr:hypothetical protein [Leeuwenhoekiella sp. ZYFB001]
MNTSTPSLKLGTLGGTVAAAVPSIQRDTLLEAVVFAGVGACVSFVVSLFLKWLFKALKTWFLNRSNRN